MLVAVEAVLIAATERDIHRRPKQNIRGPKLLWRVIATQNVVGFSGRVLDRAGSFATLAPAA